MAVELVSRWARRYVAFAALALVGAHVAVVVGAGHEVVVTLSLYGFVLHVVFGKAYSLVPTYFDRDLAWPRAMPAQFALTTTGTTALALNHLAGTPDVLAPAGAILWSAGVIAFVGTLAWTVRGNVTGAETATGSGKDHLAPTDRVANAFVPVVLAYLLLGSYATLVVQGVAPVVAIADVPVLDMYPPRAIHLLGAGTAALLVFALGTRLFPRFLVVSPPRRLLYVALGAGAYGPADLAVTIPSRSGFAVGATLQATAVVAYAIAFAVMFHRSPRDRVAFEGVLLGAAAGVAAVAIGVWFALDGLTVPLVDAHRRLTLLGFLGLTVVGVTLQFYPPSVGAWRWCSTRGARIAIGALATGVALQAIGAATTTAAIETAGGLAGIAGALAYTYLIAAAFATR